MPYFLFAASLSKVNADLHSFKTKGGKSKRMRTSFTSEQLSRLEKEFARQQYMVGSERFLLASALQLTEAQVNRKCFRPWILDISSQSWYYVHFMRQFLTCIHIFPGQSLVPESTNQVAQTESGAAAGQTGQTGPGCSTEKSWISRPRR